MGELEARTHVARGEDARVGGAQIVVHLHAPRRECYARRLEAQAVHVRRAAGGHDNGVHRHFAGVSGTVLVPQDLVFTPHLDGEQRGRQGQLDAVPQHGFLHDVRSVVVLPVEHVVAGVDKRDPGTHAAKRLRQFAADGSAADDGDPRRAFGEAEHRLVGEVAGLGQAFHGRRHRSSAGGDDRLGEAQGLAAHLDLARPGEPSLAQKHVNTRLTVALYRVVAADPRPQTPHARHGESEIHGGIAVGLDAVLRSVPQVRPRCRGADDALAGHAAVVEAVAAHEVFFDERHPRTEPRGADGRYQARRARAQHNQVVGVVRGRVFVVRGMRVGQQVQIVLVRRRYVDRGRAVVLIRFGGHVQVLLLSRCRVMRLSFGTDP